MGPKPVRTDRVLAELQRLPRGRWTDLLATSRRFHLIAAVAVMLFVTLDLRAATYSVRLEWDANSEPDIAEYKVYWGPQSGAPNQSRKVGNVTTATVDNLDDGTTYFFTVTAINEADRKAAVQRGFPHDAVSATKAL